MSVVVGESEALANLHSLAGQHGFWDGSRPPSDVVVCRTSSRFCLGVEHGDYNGTELFGVGTDRFIWLAFRPTSPQSPSSVNNYTEGPSKIRLVSHNFPADGVVEYVPGSTTELMTPEQREAASWKQFPLGVDYVLTKHGFKLTRGFDAVIYGNIPGGGMSRSASLSINLTLVNMRVNGLKPKYDFQIVELTQQVENEFIGSPCGQLDQIMIYYAKDGMGTHFNPKTKKITYVPLGQTEEAAQLRIVGLDTGTTRHGLESSTYSIRSRECKEFVQMLQESGYKISSFGDLDEEGYTKATKQFSETHPHLCKRMKYIYEAQKRFYKMMDAWKQGDVATVGAIFRLDGQGLRDDYEISGPQLESICDIARTVDGVLGERMLGGGDFGASGALMMADAEEDLRAAVATGYPRAHPAFGEKYAVHVCKMVEGVKFLHVDDASKL